MVRRVSDDLTDLGAKCICANGGDLTYRQLFDVLSERGHALLTLFLSLPFFVPIPIPGLSIVVGPLISVFGIFMALGLPPWLPKRLLDHRCDSKLLGKFLSLAGRALKRLDRYIRPRGRFLSLHPWMHRLNGLMIALCGFLLALPLPPGTNVPPACASILLSIGVLEEDDLFVAFGYILTTLITVLFGVGIFFGVEVLERALLYFFPQ